MRSKTVFTAAALLLLNLPALAGTHSIVIENDKFTGSDDSYSNGLIYSWTSNPLNSGAHNDCGQESLRAKLWCLPGLQKPKANRFLSYSIIHEIHTPENIEIVEAQLDDQPYASVLLLAMSMSSQSENWSHYWSLRGGMVGPATGGEKIQSEFHRLIDANIPRGWDNQLPSEALLNVGYFGGRSFIGEFGRRWQWRLTPAANVELGNYVTAIGVGALWETGINLSDAPTIGSLGQGLGSTTGLGNWGDSEWSIGFYVGFANYQIAHYLPLDGTVFRESQSFNYDGNIFLGSAGFKIQRGRFGIGFGVTYGSPDTQIQEDDVDFGTLNISWNFD